ncbi:helix-turn-helix domain-containing protein [Halobacteria archaeon AArc-m2/3/4]|uniref:Helix-turn-helix domain-containing protein n=1 Tax=Natronoglomus mannanivorans TaxID=2979990 RepID=A0ABT2QBW4_9EURY|nr:helix-turn-helix domain-containing protein [Halobacteria archaeon AArc-m2/3/4]
MSTLIEFTIPAAAVALEDAFRRHPHLRVKLGRSVTRSAGRSIVWTVGVAPSKAGAALAADESIDAVTCLTAADGTDRTEPADRDQERSRAIHEVEWADGLPSVLHSLAHDGTVLEATAVAGRWHVTAVAPDRESLTEVYRSCDAPLEIESITTTTVDAVRGRSTLTECQRETVSAALEHDFYQIPRAVTLEELAADLDVSHQAVSERLRRSHRTLATQAIDE